MDSVVLTLMAAGISGLFGVLVTQWRARDTEQKDRIATLEQRLEKRDSVLETNTQAMKDLATAVDDMAGMMRDVKDMISGLRRTGQATRDDERGERA